MKENYGGYDFASQVMNSWNDWLCVQRCTGATQEELSRALVWFRLGSNTSFKLKLWELDFVQPTANLVQFSTSSIRRIVNVIIIILQYQIASSMEVQYRYRNTVFYLSIVVVPGRTLEKGQVVLYKRPPSQFCMQNYFNPSSALGTRTRSRQNKKTHVASEKRKLTLLTS